MMEIRLTGSWGKAGRDFAKIAATVHGTMLEQVKESTTFLADEIKKGIDSQAPGGFPFVPLSPITIERKGSSVALIDTGDMKGSIQPHIYQSGTEGFAGIAENAKNRKGDNLFFIGTVHEFGAASSKVHIPARPFVGPIYRLMTPEVFRQFTDHFKKTLFESGGEV